MSTRPQPHEGIVGSDYPGDHPLIPGGEHIANLAAHLYRATLVGNRAPVIRDLHQRMTNPRAGDLVVVSDSVNHRDPSIRERGVGYLIAVREEWWTTDEEWEQERAEDDLSDDDRAVEPAAWYVQYGPRARDVCRWTNCTVLAMPKPGDRWPS